MQADLPKISKGGVQVANSAKDNQDKQDELDFIQAGNQMVVDLRYEIFQI